MMNIYDIAKLAGVSIATVSRVVNDSPKVSAKTGEKVRRIMEENNYTPNVFARGLGLNSIKTVGIVCPDVADTYMAKAVSYLEKNLRGYGYDCVLYCSSYEEEDKQQAVELIFKKRIDALLLVGSDYSGPGNTDYIAKAAEQIPVFLINGFMEGENIYCVLADDYQAVYDEPDPRLFLYSENSIHATRDLLLRQRNLDIDCVIATEDGLAIGALKYASIRGLKVPGEINVVGYNNSELSISCEPELTSVDNRVEVLCKTAIDSLMTVLSGAGSDVRHRQMVKCHLIKRNTTDF